MRLVDAASKQRKKLGKPVALILLVFMDPGLQRQKTNPRALGKSLKGRKLGEFWHYRVGEYRIICNI
jgi:mRNA interferase RelE/StbE